MDDINDDELFLDAVDTVVIDVVERLGHDPEARLRLSRLLAVAQEDGVRSRSPQVLLPG